MSRWHNAMRGAVMAALILGASGAWAGENGGGGNSQGGGGGNSQGGGSRSVPLLDPSLGLAAAAAITGGGIWLAKRRRR
jgi:hypothetical protein